MLEIFVLENEMIVKWFHWWWCECEWEMRKRWGRREKAIKSFHLVYFPFYQNLPLLLNIGLTCVLSPFGTPLLPSSSPLWFLQKTEGILVKLQANTHHKSQGWIFGSVHFPLAAPPHEPTKSFAITFLISFSFSWTFSHPSPPPLQTQP